MSDQEDDQQIVRRRDALLLKLLKTPPQSRADLAEQVRRAKGKAKPATVRAASHAARKRAQ
jgi:hypothetical protein